MTTLLHKWSARRFEKVRSDQNWVVLVERQGKPIVACAGSYERCKEYAKKSTGYEGMLRLERRANETVA